MISAADQTNAQSRAPQQQAPAEAQQDGVYAVNKVKANLSSVATACRKYDAKCQLHLLRLICLNVSGGSDDTTPRCPLSYYLILC